MNQFGERIKIKNVKFSNRINLQFWKSFLIISVALLVATYLSESIEIGNVFSFIFLALAIWILNIVIRPFIILFTLPFVLLTLGAGIIVVDAIVIWFASGIIPYIKLNSFWNALFIGFLIELFSWCTAIYDSRKLEREAKRNSDDDHNPGNDVIDV